MYSDKMILINRQLKADLLTVILCLKKINAQEIVIIPSIHAPPPPSPSRAPKNKYQGQNSLQEGRKMSCPINTELLYDHSYYSCSTYTWTFCCKGMEAISRKIVWGGGHAYRA